MFFILTEDPEPNVLGYVCIPISFTLNPANFDLIANSAPMKGLFEVKIIFFTIFFLIKRDPVDISLKFVLNKSLKIILYIPEIIILVVLYFFLNLYVITKSLLLRDFNNLGKSPTSYSSSPSVAKIHSCLHFFSPVLTAAP